MMTSSTQGDEEETPQFVVEKILDDTIENGVHYFKVKWVGFSEADCTYEPAENLIACLDLVNEYLVRKEKRAKRKKPEQDY